ncbi:MAG: hypothetical protein ABH864_00725 [archaeon]
MKNEKEEILEKAAKEYFASGQDELNKKRYNSAVVLFFKSLTSLTDLFLLQNTNKTPSSHADRFQKLRKGYPEIYDLIDKDFPFYQDSYVQTMTNELAEIIKDDAKSMAEKTKVELQ